MGKKLTRREFVAGASAAAGAWLFPSCSSLSTTHDEDWLSNADPIQKVRGPLSGYTGDNPDLGHSMIRDRAPGPLGIKPSRSEKIVIVGGGVSGLACGYLLRDKKPVIIERAAQFGGNAKAESWNGIDYTIGAAYLTDANPESPLTREYFKPLGIDKKWKKAHNEFVELQGKLTVPKSPQIRQFEEFLHHIYDEKFPDIPRTPDSAVSEKEFREWDRKSFYRFVRERIVRGNVDPVLHSIFEHYCFAAFGGSSRDISAAAALNFMASEVKGIYVLPGGNSCLTSHLLRAVASVIPRENLMTNSAVTHVRLENGGAVVEYLDAEGNPSAIRADHVVMACPKFIAAKVLGGLPDSQRQAMEKIKYRAYLVANCLYRGKLEKDFYDIYLLGDGKIRGDARLDDENQGATDAIASHWWYGPRESSDGVLTLFHALPYEGARAGVLLEETMSEYRRGFKRQAEDLIRLLGGKAEISEVRVTRWGHPLVLCETGAISNGIGRVASKTIGERIFFCNQDNWLLPATETGLTEALAVRAKLGAI